MVTKSWHPLLVFEWAEQGGLSWNSNSLRWNDANLFEWVNLFLNSQEGVGFWMEENLLEIKRWQLLQRIFHLTRRGDRIVSGSGQEISSFWNNRFNGIVSLEGVFLSLVMAISHHLTPYWSTQIISQALDIITNSYDLKICTFLRFFDWLPFCKSKNMPKFDMFFCAT